VPFYLLDVHNNYQFSEEVIRWHLCKYFSLDRRGGVSLLFEVFELDGEKRFI